MPEKTSKFIGFPSGDYESMCFAVNEEDYEEIQGEKPEFYHENPFHKGRFNLYPDNLLPELDKNTEYEFEVTVKAKPVIRKE